MNTYYRALNLATFEAAIVEGMNESDAMERCKELGLQPLEPVYRFEEGGTETLRFYWLGSNEPKPRRTQTEETRTVSETGGAKGVKPEAFDAIPTDSLRALARVYGFGTSKYPSSNGLDNWRNGYEYSKCYAAAMRHLTAWWGGEDTDPESGESHLMHAAWHMFTLAHWQNNPDMKRFDDRQDPRA